MAEQPPAALVATLEHLGLATADEIARMGPRVRRLARDLPRFESVWVDALSQARILTPFQAAELNAGRGPSLRVGPYVILERLAHPYYVACYRGAERRFARNGAAGGRSKTPAPGPTRSSPNWSPGPFEAERIHSKWALAAHPMLAPWRHHRCRRRWRTRLRRGALDGRTNGGRMDRPSRPIPGRGGAGNCPGDAGRPGRTGESRPVPRRSEHASLILTDGGDVRLSLPGLRGILRPEEGYAYADLLPEAYDTLAPERIAAGTPPQMAERDVRLRLPVVAPALRSATAGRRRRLGQAACRAGGRDLRRAAPCPGCSGGAGVGDFQPARSGNRAGGPNRWLGWRPCSARRPAAAKRRWPIVWLAQAGPRFPGRPRSAASRNRTARRFGSPAASVFWPRPSPCFGRPGIVI